VFTWTSSASAVVQVGNDGGVTAIAVGSAAITASGGGRSGSATVTVSSGYDLDALGAPRIITRDYIELAKIERIARFRSGIGHDYSDDVEHCRSMKHYFQPLGTVDWSTVVISAPVDGTIASIDDEQTFGKQLHITPTALSLASVVIFHVKPDAGTVVGATVAAGARLGTHIGSQTMSDIAIWLNTPRGRRLVSYFDAMVDGVFANYQARGVASRADLSITAAERDASPLACTGETFAGAGTLVNWVTLR